MTLTADLQTESPVYNVEVTLKNAELDTNAVLEILDEQKDSVETREVWTLNQLEIRNDYN